MKEMNMNFGEAIEALKSGAKVSRVGWNEKNMWIILVPGANDVKLNKNAAYYRALQIDSCDILPHIDMWTLDSNERQVILPGWQVRLADMLSEDWYIVA
jgi:hypothetical protein